MVFSRYRRRFFPDERVCPNLGFTAGGPVRVTQWME
jgi:hypothetical protein